MSYILDALVKADQERQRQGVPGLHTVQSGLSARDGAQRRWPVGVAGAMLAAGLLSLAWGRFWQGPAPVAALLPEPGRGAPMPRVPAAPPAAAPADRPLAPSPVASPSRPPVPVREAMPERAQAIAAEKTPKPGSRLYNIAELPPALQEQARKIKVAGFAQASDAGERLAIINDRAWREGDEVTTGLRVERIANDGVIFNLKGYRFRKGGA